MPTSPRDLTDGKCRFLWENPPPCHRTSRADVGIGPYAVGETILSPTTAECFRGPLHTRPCGATLSKQERAGDACGGRGAVPGRVPVPPHTRHACGVPPSPRRGFVPSSVRAFGPATFPGGEGFLRRGRAFICPRGSLRIRACLCSGLLPSLPGGPPAPRRPWPPAHTLRGKRKWGRSSRSGSLRPGECHRSA